MRLYVLIFFTFQIIHANSINFSYGIIGDLKSNPKTLSDLKDQSEIVSGDRIRINAGFNSQTNFYLIYKDANDDYSLLYDKVELKKINKSDTLYINPLPWSTFEAPIGTEIFYLINTSEPLIDLKKILLRYLDAPKKGKVKLGKKIQNMLNLLDPNSVEDLSSITNRLDKPIVGGVAFRGENDTILKPQSLIYQCEGVEGIAFQKISINHK